MGVAGTARRGIALPFGVLLLTLALLVPAIINRGMFLFPDTTAYVRGADGAMVQIAGRQSRWSDRLLKPAVPSSSPTQAETPQPASSTLVGSRIVLAGRSIYYGAFLYVALLIGGFWAVGVVQAMVAATALLLTLARFAPQRNGIAPGTFAALLLLALLTPLGFFADFAMPDLFAALAMLAGVNILLAWGKMGVKEQAFWLALIVAGVLFHSATLLLVALLAGAALLVRWRWPETVRSGRTWPLVLAVLLGFGGEAMFSAGVRHATGLPPLRPPFLTARLIDDGPGLAYLRTHCGSSDAPRVCRYRDRLPLPSDAFLWSDDPATGVFRTGTADEQRALAADEGHFVREVVRADPLGVILAAGRNAWHQLFGAGLAEFNYDAGVRSFFVTRLPEPELRQAQATAAWHDTMPTRIAVILAMPLAALSLLAILVMGRRAAGARRCALWLIAAVLFNAAICGAMSGPHDRYGARMIWLLPFAAIVVTSARHDRRERRAG